VFDSERERRNDAVYAEHREALSRGEKRLLRKTATGELHSYAGDEIGFSPGRGQAQVRTWWGMSIVSAVLWLLSVEDPEGARRTQARQQLAWTTLRLPLTTLARKTGHAPLTAEGAAP
jgi:hypothetical protein